MKSLYAYLDLIDARLLTYIDGQKGRFIQILQEERFVLEDVFKNRICGDNRDDNYYYTLKHHVVATLKSLATMAPLRGANEVTKKIDLCRQDFLLGQKMIRNNAREAGIELIENAHKIAVSYDFCYLACELSSVLYHHHIYHDLSRVKAEEYRQQVERYLKDYTAEKHAEDILYQRIGKKVSENRPEHFEEALQKMRKCKGQSLTYVVYEGTLEVMYGYSLGDYEYVLMICRRMIEFFQDKKGVYSSYYQSYYTNQGIAFMAMGLYQKAEQSFEYAVPYAPRHSFNDYLVRLYRTINALHSGQYALAYDLYKKGTRCKHKPIREQFGIIEAYLCFLSCNGFFTLDKRFRISKYLNETFRAQADKKGDNIAIIIAELLVYLVRNRGKFIDRIEAVSNYTYRHLREPEHQRAKRFIQILTLLPRANFNAVAINRIAHRHITYIQDHPIRMGQNVFLEIIPFERLLDMLQYHLQQKRA